MVIEAFRKAQEAKQQPQGVLLKDVLRGEKSGVFGLYLERENEERLAEKIFTEEELDQADFVRLAELREGFVKELERVETVRQFLQTEWLPRIIGSSADFAAVRDVVGLENIQKALSKNMETLALNGDYRDQFDDIYAAIHSPMFGQRQREVAEKNEEIRAFAEAYGVHGDALGRALAIDDPSKREQEVVRLVRNAVPRRFFERFNPGAYEDRIFSIADQLNRRDEIERQLGWLDLELSNIADVLSTTMLDNEEVRRALHGALHHEKMPQQEPETKLTEAKKLLPSQEELELDMGKQWQEYRKGIADWETLDAGSQDVHRETFRTRYAEKKVKGTRGLWAWIFGNFLDAMSVPAKARLT